MSLFREEALLAKQPKLHGRIILAQPLSTFLITACIALFFILGGILAFTMEYARSEQAIGLLTPTNGLVKVFPRRSGVVTELYIREGMEISAGDPIALILVEESSRNGISTEAMSIDHLQNKLILFEEQKALLLKKAKLDIIKIREERSNLSLTVGSLSKRLKQQKEIIEIASSGFTRSQELVETGQISRATFEERARLKLSAEQALETLIQSYNDASAQLALVSQKSASNELDRELQINQLSAQILDIKQAIVELDGRRTYILKAPIAGKASSVLTSIGREVSPQLSVATIIPAGGKLIAELYVPSRVVGFIKAGQKVRLGLEALPYEEFGYVPATVLTITNTILNAQ